MGPLELLPHGYRILSLAHEPMRAGLPLQVAAFQCLQPFVGTMLAFAVLGEEPSIWDLGAIGIFTGLLLVVFDRRDLTAGPLSLGTGMRRILSSQKVAQLVPFRLQSKLKTEKSGDKDMYQGVL